MKIAILGNSGSGKSTLAAALAREAGASVPVLDLDTIVWEPGQVAVPRDSAAVRMDLQRFCAQHPRWIVEGCYGDLIEALLPQGPELVFVNPGLAQCIANCRNRPWEPHKYASRAEQDARLEFLLQWVADYYQRDGDMSLAGHRRLFDAYQGPRRELVSLPDFAAENRSTPSRSGENLSESQSAR